MPVRQLWALSRLSNQAIGDALSGLLMVDAALTLTNWDLPTWLRMYTELPSRQLKASWLGVAAMGLHVALVLTPASLCRCRCLTGVPSPHQTQRPGWSRLLVFRTP